MRRSRERVVDGVAALHPDERGDPALLEDPLHVVRRQRQLERLRVAPDHLMDGVDLLERRGHGGLARQLDRHVDGPELPTDAARLEAWRCRS